jgi:hypothetical protein
MPEIKHTLGAPFVSGAGLYVGEPPVETLIALMQEGEPGDLALLEQAYQNPHDCGQEECAGYQKWLAWQELLEVARLALAHVQRGDDPIGNRLIYDEDNPPSAQSPTLEGVLRAAIAKVEEK